jgi:hypothetical protein
MDGGEYKKIWNIFEQREALARQGERHGWRRIKKPAQGWLFCLLSHKPSKMAERTGLEPARLSTSGVTGRPCFNRE